MTTVDPRKHWTRYLLLAVLVLPAACGTRLNTAQEPTTVTSGAEAQQPGQAAPGAAAGSPLPDSSTLATGQTPAAALAGTQAVSPGAGQKQTAPRTKPAPSGVEGKQTGKNVSTTGAPPGGTAAGRATGTAPTTCSGSLSTMNIGTVGEYSGLAGAALLNGVKSVQAWVQSVNAKGGIQCHPVKYIVADDGGDPAKNQTATHNLVERDNVVAMVNADAPLAGPASVQYLTQKGIPTIGGSGVDPWFYDSPMFFPQASEPNAGWLAAYSALGSYAKSLGSKNVALVYCVETPICAAVGQLAKTAAPKVGVTMAYVTQTTVVQPDYTSVCLNAQKSNAPVLWYVLDANSGIRLARSCDSVGYHPKYFAIAIHTAPSMAGMPSFDGLGSVSFVLPWMVTSNPSIATYHAVMKQYGAGVEPDGVGVSGWTSAMLFQAAVTHTQLSNTPTSQDILNGLYALNKDDLGGLTYPITFKKGEKPPQVACGWFVSLKNGRWISPNGTKPVICE